MNNKNTLLKRLLFTGSILISFVGGVFASSFYWTRVIGDWHIKASAADISSSVTLLDMLENNKPEQMKILINGRLDGGLIGLCAVDTIPHKSELVVINALKEAKNYMESNQYRVEDDNVRQCFQRAFQLIK